MKRGTRSGFHRHYDARVRPWIDPRPRAEWPERLVVKTERVLRYRFHAHFHPYVTELVERLIEGSVSGLQEADTETLVRDGRVLPAFSESLFSSNRYGPTGMVSGPHPVKDLDFRASGAYSVYNWELFYHVPLTVAIHLSRNHRFQEAMQWLHYIFDPTDDSDGPTPERFWKVKPLRTTDVKMIEEILVNLSTGDDEILHDETVSSISAWKDSPFRPHLVARYRHSAYMFKAVMAYLDNLIAWGDSLFRQDTGETINEATQLYVMAANLLGPRPEEVPKKGSVRPQTYANLRSDLDELGNALRELESELPFDLAPHPTGASRAESLTALRSIGQSLYFCVPRNEKLMAYWDTVADRLFKIRNSLNIRGIFRQLPLFEPPIDPALLAKAVASGLDIAAVVSGANQPLPLVRFSVLLRRSLDLCQEVRTLGKDLLAAMEKQDSEELVILRAKHERVISNLAESVRYQQWQEAIKARQALEVSLANSGARYRYYERLLGTPEDEIVLPEVEELDREALEDRRFRGSEPEMALREIEITHPPELAAAAAGGRQLNSEELAELTKLAEARERQVSAGAADRVGAAMGMVPNFSANFQPLGAGGTISFGGSNLAAWAQLNAAFIRAGADASTYEAGKAAKMGSYARREQEWAFQSNVAAGEVSLLHKQVRAAQIRENLARREWENQQQQIRHAEEIEQFLTDEKKGKTTNLGFITWVKRETKGLYGRCFQLAFDIGRKAERALQRELGDPQASYLEFGYLGGREGLLAGERLYLDLKRMEMAYDDLNEREYELTRHVSLMQVDPTALLRLRQTGRCTFKLAEELFDLGGAGHYFRRIRTVAVSLPCVVGPYASVNCTLSLLRSSVRTSPLLREGIYERDGAEDSRFSDHLGSLQSIVTSSARDDSGLFEADLHDSRYLPFEGSGVISEWQLELPNEVRQFDYDTITDVILHLRYTAREGGEILRRGANLNLESKIGLAQAAGSVRLFNVRREFPSAWSEFRATEPNEHDRIPLTLEFRQEHYPFWSRDRLKALHRLALFVRSDRSSVEVSLEPFGGEPLSRDKSLGDLFVGSLSEALPSPKGSFTLFLDSTALEELWLGVWWGDEQ